MAENFHDEEFQKVVLAYVWREKGFFSRYEDSLSPSYFDSSLNASIFGAILSYYKEYRKTPSKEVLFELTRSAYSKDTEDDRRKRSGQEIRIKELAELDITDGKFIEQKIREFLSYKALYEFVHDAVDGLKKRQYDPELPKKARVALSKGEELFKTGIEWTGDIYSRVMDHYQDDNEFRVPTGLTMVDESLREGGLRAGELGIVLAPPKGFKSGTLINFAYGGLRHFFQHSPAFEEGESQFNMGYFTLELSESLVSQRFDRCCLGWDNLRIKSDPIGAAKGLENIRQFLGGKLFIKEYGSKTASCDTFREYVDRMWEQHGLKFCALFVDYLDLVKASGKDGKYREDTVAGLICEDLRAIAIDYKIPVWTACRATRDAFAAPVINMKHMSRSFERVGIADIVIAICQTEMEKSENKLRLVPVASRNDGTTKQVICTVDYPRMRLYNNEVAEIEYEESKGAGKAATGFANKGLLKSGSGGGNGKKTPKAITGELAD